MFAGIYAPPESTGIVEHITWNIFWMIGDFPSVKSMDNILKGIYGEPIRKGHENDNGKFHGTIIDFDTVGPGEEKEQIIVKIMFTGYTNRTDMHNRINEIIERIPEYQLNSTYRNREGIFRQNFLSLGSVNLPFP
jgi:hypothetical protein